MTRHFFYYIVFAFMMTSGFCSVEPDETPCELPFASNLLTKMKYIFGPHAQHVMAGEISTLRQKVRKDLQAKNALLRGGVPSFKKFFVEEWTDSGQCMAWVKDPEQDIISVINAIDTEDDVTCDAHALQADEAKQLLPMFQEERASMILCEIMRYKDGKSTETKNPCDPKSFESAVAFKQLCQNLALKDHSVFVKQYMQCFKNWDAKNQTYEQRLHTLCKDGEKHHVCASRNRMWRDTLLAKVSRFFTIKDRSDFEILTAPEGYITLSMVEWFENISQGVACERVSEGLFDPRCAHDVSSGWITMPAMSYSFLSFAELWKKVLGLSGCESVTCIVESMWRYICTLPTAEEQSQAFVAVSLCLCEPTLSANVVLSEDFNQFLKSIIEASISLLDPSEQTVIALVSGRTMNLDTPQEKQCDVCKALVQTWMKTHMEPILKDAWRSSKDPYNLGQDQARFRQEWGIKDINLLTVLTLLESLFVSSGCRTYADMRTLEGTLVACCDDQPRCIFDADAIAIAVDADAIAVDAVKKFLTSVKECVQYTLWECNPLVSFKSHEEGGPRVILYLPKPYHTRIPIMTVELLHDMQALRVERLLAGYFKNSYMATVWGQQA